MTMLRQQRHDRILDVVKQRKVCSINDLRQELGVSQVTIYRDLKELQRENMVSRVHGGVSVPEVGPIESRFAIRLDSQREAKERIGRYEAEKVCEGWAIFVDASTTCFVFAQALAARGVGRVTLVTNSPQIPMEMQNSPQIQVISTGGELQHQLNAFAGPMALSQMASMHFDAAYLSAAGICASHGLTTDSPLLAEILRTVVAKSQRTNVLVDNSKFYRRGLISSLRVDQVDRVITDSKVTDEVAKEFQSAGTKLEIVSESNGMK
jgi:DeoR/GlpR family transcriptional regulator of sugar metabolism